MAKANFLNTMTIIGYVFVGLFVFMATYLGIAYGTGYFNPQKDPVIGLKYVDASKVVISENGGTYKLKIVSGNATIEQSENGETIVTDTATPVDVRLTVRNSSGLIDNSIISVPETVKTGEEFEITALINEEDGFDCNVGGDCKITAETVDGIYKALDLSVFVDVPIKEIEITAKNPNNNANIDLATANFIYDDKIQLVANVYPSRALNPHTDGTIERKQIEFTPDDTSCTEIINKNTGLVRISYNPTSSGEMGVTEPTLATVTATAKTLLDTSLAQNVTQDCQIRLFPIQLEEIVINNKVYADSAKTIDTLLFDNDNLVKFSAQDTGDSSIINLDLFLKPTIYNPDNNSNPLVNQLNNVNITCQSTKTNYPTPVDVIMDFKNGIKYFMLKPLRTLEADEEVTLSISIQGYDSKTITRDLEVKFTTPDEFNFLDSFNNTITTYNMEISKTGDVIDTNGTSVSSIKSAVNPSTTATNSDIYYTYDNSTTPTFSKFVFFVNTEKAKNEVNSLIIDINEETGQLKKREGYDTINARGAGNIQIIPYVVRTNEEGKAVDCNYDVIEDASAKGFVMYNETFDTTNDAQKYVVYKQYSPLKVSVVEKLTGFTLFATYDKNGATSSERFTDIINSETNDLSDEKSYKIGTTTTNAKTFYAVPNSPLALPTQESYNDWVLTNGEISFAEKLKDTYTERLRVNTSNKKISAIGDKENYQRFLSFEVYTENAIETLGAISINHMWNGTISSSAVVCIKAENVKVANVALNTSDTGISVGFDKYSKTKNWDLKLNIDKTVISANSQNYARAYWTQSIKNVNKKIEIPSIIMTANEEWSERGCKPSIPEYELGFYAFSTSEKLTLNGVDYDVCDIINTINDNQNDEIANQKMAFIEKLMKNTTKNDYAEIRTLSSGVSTLGKQTIQFKKELPENMVLFLVCSVPDTSGDAKPDFVRITYSFPKVALLDTKQWTDENNTEINSTVNNNIAYYYTSSLTKAYVYNEKQISKDNLKYDFNNDQLDSSITEEERKYCNVVKIDACNTYKSTLFFDDNVNDALGNKIFKVVTATTTDEVTTRQNPEDKYTVIQLNSDAYEIVTSENDSTYTLTITCQINISINAVISDTAWATEQVSGDLGTDVINFIEKKELTITIKNGSIEKKTT